LIQFKFQAVFAPCNPEGRFTLHTFNPNKKDIFILIDRGSSIKDRITGNGYVFGRDERLHLPMKE
jgi:hypothetical protein